MTATKSKRMTAKKKTLERKRNRKDKWHFQEAWYHVEEIKKHLDSMDSSGDVLCNQSTATWIEDSRLPHVVGWGKD